MVPGAVNNNNDDIKTINNLPAISGEIQAKRKDLSASDDVSSSSGESSN